MTAAPARAAPAAAPMTAAPARAAPAAAPMTAAPARAAPAAAPMTAAPARAAPAAAPAAKTECETLFIEFKDSGGRRYRLKISRQDHFPSVAEQFSRENPQLSGASESVLELIHNALREDNMWGHVDPLRRSSVRIWWNTFLTVPIGADAAALAREHARTHAMSEKDISELEQEIVVGLQALAPLPPLTAKQALLHSQCAKLMEAYNLGRKPSMISDAMRMEYLFLWRTVKWDVLAKPRLADFALKEESDTRRPSPLRHVDEFAKLMESMLMTNKLGRISSNSNTAASTKSEIALFRQRFFREFKQLTPGHLRDYQLEESNHDAAKATRDHRMDLHILTTTGRVVDRSEEAATQIRSLKQKLSAEGLKAYSLKAEGERANATADKLQSQIDQLKAAAASSGAAAPSAASSVESSALQLRLAELERQLEAANVRVRQLESELASEQQVSVARATEIRDQAKRNCDEQVALKVSFDERIDKLERAHKSSVDQLKQEAATANAGKRKAETDLATAQLEHRKRETNSAKEMAALKSQMAHQDRRFWQQRADLDDEREQRKKLEADAESVGAHQRKKQKVQSAELKKLAAANKKSLELIAKVAEEE